jgi:xanthine dehydrogenase small subunit
LRDYIVFHVNGKEHRARGREVFTTLSNWLRYDVGATGTKIVCEEGDCGACTVLVAGNDWYVPVNSCIQSLWQLDGASIVTVEGLTMDGQLSPVQEAMVQCHGAQCGYCTPGFVVAMAGLFEGYGSPGACSMNEPLLRRGEKLTEKQVRDGLTGNLCRCTGYEPIIKAALAIDETAMPGLAERYGYGPATPDSVLIEADGRTFFAPATLKEAIEFKASHPGCTIVQGGTDVGVWINKRGFAPATMLSLRKIAELTALTAASETPDGNEPRKEVPGTITAAANVTLADFEQFIENRVPQLFAILNIFGSPQIKNAGTLVGNIANGSPIGDTLPFLFVAGAELELAGLNAAASRSSRSTSATGSSTCATTRSSPASSSPRSPIRSASTKSRAARISTSPPSPPPSACASSTTPSPTRAWPTEAWARPSSACRRPSSSWPASRCASKPSSAPAASPPPRSAPSPTSADHASTGCCWRRTSWPSAAMTSSPASVEPKRVWRPAPHLTRGWGEEVAVAEELLLRRL